MNNLRDSLFEKEAALEAARVERQRLLDEFSSRESTLENTIQSHITQIRRDKEAFEREKASIVELKEEDLGKLRARTEALQSQVDDLTARIEDLSAEAYVCLLIHFSSLSLSLFLSVTNGSFVLTIVLIKRFAFLFFFFDRSERENMTCSAQY